MKKCVTLFTIKVEYIATIKSRKRNVLVVKIPLTIRNEVELVW